ncbi:NUDIX hydrolase [Streptomyces californicus]|uniref:NUDIX hydrolase n=1 Tax=Streptomyces californicus TaxID=67351 RepID=UPI0036A43AEE
MPPSRTHIHELVTAYLGRHPGERPALGPLVEALDAPGEVTARAMIPGHITCSAAVIDHDGRVLHVRHNASGGTWLLPGGHVEPEDATLMAAAVREIHEETGIPPQALRRSAAFRHEPADIDVHPIDANPAKGEPAHQHYDFRFVFHLVPPSAETTPQPEEVSGTDWRPIDQVTSLTMRSKLLAADLSAGPEPVLRHGPRRGRGVSGGVPADHRGVPSGPQPELTHGEPEDPVVLPGPDLVRRAAGTGA